MKTARVISVLAVIALLAMGCETDEPTATDTPTPAPETELGTPTPDGDVDEAVLERIATAVGNTVDEGTARFTIEARTAGGQPGTDDTGMGTDDTGTDDTGTGTDDTGTGTDDTGTGTGTTQPGATQDIMVEGQVDFDEELRELQFTGPQGQLTAIIDGDELYIQLPATEEGEFARIDLDELTDADMGFGGPAGLPFQDPQGTLEVLREAAIEARVLDDGPTGTPDVDATPTPDDDLDATPTPDVDASPTPEDDLDTTPTPDDGTDTDTGTGTTDATPTPDDDLDDGTPTPDVDASPTPEDDLDATPTPDADATPTPEDDLDGTPSPEDARHLLVVIDLQQAGEGAEARHFGAMAEQYGIETVEMEVWIDEQDRIEQISYLLPLSEARITDDDLDGTGTDTAATPTPDADATPTPEGGLDATPTPDVDAEVDPQDDLVVTVTYYDFGAPVDITVPDEDEVVDLDEDELRRSLPAEGTTGQRHGTTTPSPTPDVGATPEDDESPSPSPSPTDDA